MKSATQNLPAQTLAQLSKILEYPGTEFHALAGQLVDNVDDGIREYILAFKGRIAGKSIAQLQEGFTRTFDLAPVCVPYVSAHIYGDENFERGNFMSALFGRYQDVGLYLNGELPDHITAMLRFMGQAEPDEAAELAHYCLQKPLAEMTRFLKEADNPYQFIFQAIEILVRKVADGGSENA